MATKEQLASIRAIRPSADVVQRYNVAGAAPRWSVPPTQALTSVQPTEPTEPTEPRQVLPRSASRAHRQEKGRNFNVRNIPVEAFDAIVAYAEAHDCSVNSAIQTILTAWAASHRES